MIYGENAPLMIPDRQNHPQAGFSFLYAISAAFISG
jgi:hypothetical protein